MAQRKNGSTLYVRGVPERLVRAAKARAAERGITLTDFVIEAVDAAVEADVADTPDERAEPDLESDQAWYEAHRPELEQRYPDQYVAIVDGEVVDHDAEFAALAERVHARFGRRHVLMPRVVPGGRVVHLPSPRVQR